jgi:hypothetical protein
VIAGFVYLTVNCAAGKTTILSAVFNVLAGINVSAKIAWTVTACAVIGWFVERKVRKRFIKRNSPGIENREKASWANRTSSGLRRDGESPKE